LRPVPTVPPGAFDGVVMGPSPVPAQLLTDAASLPARFAEQRGGTIADEDVTRLSIDELWNGAMGEHWRTGAF
jgi:hypothetical protein